MHTVFILFTYFSFFSLSVSTIAFDVRDCWVENFSFIFIKFRWPLFAFHLNATAFLVRPTIEWMTIAIFFYFYFSFVFISNILSISYFHLHERFVACLMQTMTAYIMQYWIYVFFFFAIVRCSKVCLHTHQYCTDTRTLINFTQYYFITLCAARAHTQILFYSNKMIDVSNFSLYIFSHHLSFASIWHISHVFEFNEHRKVYGRARAPTYKF